MHVWSPVPLELIPGQQQCICQHGLVHITALLILEYIIYYSNGRNTFVELLIQQSSDLWLFKPYTRSAMLLIIVMRGWELDGGRKRIMTYIMSTLV